MTLWKGHLTKPLTGRCNTCVCSELSDTKRRLWALPWQEEHCNMWLTGLPAAWQMMRETSTTDRHKRQGTNHVGEDSPRIHLQRVGSTHKNRFNHRRQDLFKWIKSAWEIKIEIHFYDECVYFLYKEICCHFRGQSENECAAVKSRRALEIKTKNTKRKS